MGLYHCFKGHFSVIYDLLGDPINDYREFKVGNIVYHNPYNTLYSIYNSLFVVALSNIFNIDYKITNNILKNFKMNDGRMEEFRLNRLCLLNLIKNPTGANEVIKYINNDINNKIIWIVLNDNGQDGIDVSWIYDVHWHLINNNSTKFICSGKRGYDIALALKYNNFDNIEVFNDEHKALETFVSYQDKGYILTTYTALQATRKLLKGFYYGN